MSIPDFQSIMQPLLRLVGDGNEHRGREYGEALAREFGLSSAERQQLLPSGRQSVFDNRVGWAATYLVKAGLLERSGRGAIRITDRGRKVLQTNVTRIDIAFLSQYPEFEEFRRRSTPDEPAASPRSPRNGSRGTGGVDPRPTWDREPPNRSLVAEQTPAELLETSYQRLRQALADELLDRIRTAPPRFFEQLVIDLLVTMGYGGSRADAGQAVGGSGDDGVDGIIKEDRLGLDFVYVQAKRWDQPVGRPLVQAFAGSLEGQRARKGVFITTSTFTRDARDYVTRIEKRIVLVDGEQLAQLMIDHGVGVADVTTYQVKRVDADYFGEA